MTKIAVLGLIAPSTARLAPLGVVALLSLGMLAGCGSASAMPEASAAYPPSYAPASVQASPGEQLESAPSSTATERDEVLVESDASSGSPGGGGGFAAKAAADAPAPPPSGADKKPIDNAQSPTSPSSPRAPSASPEARGPSAQAEAPHDAAMLIYTAHITMAVYQVEPGLAAVETIARDLGGYLANRTDTQITVRIPRRRFDEAVRRVGLTGDVVHRDIAAQDVTDEVVDLEARLKNARNMRDRLAELLKRADVKAAIEIEKELGRVTGEIEQMEGKLKVLRDKIAYSTITVSFQARGPGALREVPLRLPFPWLSELGLPRLLSLHE